jgi:hypothetical protein
VIKFFRHIRQNLLMENRTGKYLKYAIGEIVLVVIGILIALQINNWNEQRKESAEEQKILKSILSGFVFNKAEILQNITETELTVQGTANMLRCFRVEADLDEFKADSLLRHMYAYSTFHPSDGALNDLINSGRLNIIKNDVLRDRLSNWNSLVLDVTEDEVYMLDFINTYVVPVRIKAIRSVKGSEFKSAARPVFEDPDFENITFRLNRLANYQGRLYKELENEIDTITALLNQAIEK